MNESNELMMSFNRCYFCITQRKGQIWQYISLSRAFRRLGHKGCQFEASLGYKPLPPKVGDVAHHLPGSGFKSKHCKKETEVGVGFDSRSGQQIWSWNLNLSLLASDGTVLTYYLPQWKSVSTLKDFSA